MIDFTVAFDKLAQFDTPDDIASYLESEGIKAYRGNASFCAVSNFISNLTGQEIETTCLSVVNIGDSKKEFRLTTTAMSEFIRRFDNGGYPELVQETDPSILSIP